MVSGLSFPAGTIENDGVTNAVGILNYTTDFAVSMPTGKAQLNDWAVGGSTFGFDALAFTATDATQLADISRVLFRNNNTNLSGTLGTALTGFAVNDLSVSFTAIPEPSTYAMLFGAMALGLVIWHRRGRA